MGRADRFLLTRRGHRLGTVPAMHLSRLAAAALAAVLLAGCTDEPATKSGPSAPPVDYAQWQAGTSAPVADPLYPRRGNPGLDVLHYGLDLRWSLKPRRLAAVATLRIRPTADATGIELDFKPYALRTVTVDGAAVKGSRVTGEKLIVPIALTKNKPVTLSVAYDGKPDTTPMPSHRTDTEPLGLTVTADGSLWTMQEPFGAFTWYPANDIPSDEALYDIAVAAPAGWSAVAGGTPGEVTGSVFHYRSTDPVATYLQTLAVGKYEKVTATGPHGLPLTYWYRPGIDDKLVPSLKKSPAFITFLEKHFGPYPFPSGGVVLVASRSGMETQQMITIGGGLPNPSAAALANYEYDLLHEYAHQWFGDSVTPTTWNDLWLNEGWAMYAQLLYQQSVEKTSDAALESYLRERDADLRKRLGPPAHPKAANFAESNVYLCPAAMLEELNDALGDQKFFDLATAWVQTQRNTQQTRASFTAFVNKHTGRDFTKLIDAWLDSPTTPGP
jgi:aminopeptidase N